MALQTSNTRQLVKPINKANPLLVLADINDASDNKISGEL
jgi:hypothetical protein